MEKINKNFETVEKYLKILDEFKINNKQDFNKNKNYLAVSMSLFTIVNSCIEIGESIIDLKNLDIPTTYKKIFLILQKNKIITKKLTDKMTYFIYLRNMIAHQYDDIEYEKIYEMFKERKTFSEFLEQIKSKI